jgi:hypothetical protein
MSGEARTFPTFDGGRQAMVVGGGVGAVGLVLTLVRAFAGEDGPRVAMFSYLTAYAYWLGLALASLIMLMIFHASHARWMIVVRRIIESMAATLALFVLLFIPIVLGMKQLYPWADNWDKFPGEVQQLLQHRSVYLNVPFFLGRAAFYLFIWVLFSQLFYRWSTRQDTSGAPELTMKSWKLGAGGLPIAGITLSFAAFDWLMSLEVHWFSSMWGVYYFAGSFVAAFAMLIILTDRLTQTPALEGALNTAHWLSLGKFLLAFTCFWAYISYSQYMLTWIANLPDTIPYLLLRQHAGWQYLGAALILGHFVIPFFILLTRWVKMKPQRLRLVAWWILIIHFVDLFCVVMPQVKPDQPWGDWSVITAMLGIGGLSVATCAFFLRGRPAIPVKDPFLADSLAYSKMM